MKRIIVAVFAINVLVSAHAFAGEPPLEKLVKLRALSVKPLQDALEEMKKLEIYLNDDALEEAVARAFSSRQDEALGLAVNILRTSPVKVLEGKRINRLREFRIAQAILRRFGNAAMRKLEKEYYSGDPELRGNIIKMFCQVNDEERVRPLLLSALDDKSFCQLEDPDAGGTPLRVCDNAYNQLAARYGPKGGVRCLGPIHRIELRDESINKLKQQLSSSGDKP